MRSWLKGAASKTASPLSSSRNASSQHIADPRDVEINDLEDAMSAAARIVNDDIDGAEAQLRARQDSSSFHQLGLGIAVFMRSILGFEKDIMAEASSRLAECESRAWSDMKKAQKQAEGGSGGGWFRGGGASAGHVPAKGCEIYPPGTEFQLLNAEAQLMSAIISVMHESLTEGIKGFYKLRKAFVALDAIMEEEARVLAAHQANGTAKGSAAPNNDNNAAQGLKGSESDSDLEFIDAKEATDELPTSTTYTGHLGKSAPDSVPEKEMEGLSLGTADTSTPSPPGTTSESPSSHEADLKTPLRTLPQRLGLSAGPDSAIFKNPVDAFVHSGANMCFGILLLIISMVPPAFSKLLYIIGFKGDRDRGVQMLWQSTKFSNVNGGVAGLMLLAYYNGILAFADILPSEQDIAEHAAPDEIVGYPEEQCITLLERMRAQYPDSRMWKVEEARVLGNARRLPEAIEMLKANGDSKMRQVTALTNFELSVNALFLMDWQTMRDGFLRCVELNDWSHSLYYYFVGAGEVEMYRDAMQALRENNNAPATDKDAATQKEQIKSTLEAEAKRHKRNAEEYLRKAPAAGGRKKFFARQMPFEVFALRKVAKWEARAKEWGCDLVDAVGASPGQEMVYLWSGAKRMPLDTLEKAVRCLRWERCTAPEDKVEKIKGMADELAIKAACESSLLCNLGRYEEAREQVMPVVAQDRYVLFETLNVLFFPFPATMICPKIKLTLTNQQSPLQRGEQRRLARPSCTLRTCRARVERELRPQVLARDHRGQDRGLSSGQGRRVRKVPGGGAQLGGLCARRKSWNEGADRRRHDWVAEGEERVGIMMVVMIMKKKNLREREPSGSRQV